MSQVLASFLDNLAHAGLGYVDQQPRESLRRHLPYPEWDLNDVSENVLAEPQGHTNTKGYVRSTLIAAKAQTWRTH